MRNIWNQMTGREPEPVWMSALGLVCIICFCVVMYLAGVGMGYK